MVNPWNAWEMTAPCHPWIPGREPRMVEWDRYPKQWISNLMRYKVVYPVYYQDKYEGKNYQSDLSEDRNHQ